VAVEAHLLIDGLAGMVLEIERQTEAGHEREIREEEPGFGRSYSHGLELRSPLFKQCQGTPYREHPVLARASRFRAGWRRGEVATPEDEEAAYGRRRRHRREFGKW
jgi:hypothetical protein